MNQANFGFKMAARDNSDALLRAIAQESMDILFEHVDKEKIVGILLTGSVANGEGTVVEHDSLIAASDFDFMVYMTLSELLKNRRLLFNLSQEITTRFVKRGIGTHVKFTPSSGILQSALHLANSSIYEYEFAHASKCLFGKPPSIDRNARPTKKDALELTFTVVSDLIFSKFKNLSEIEESYIYAKRALTLLNSLLIFLGVFAETYQERLKIARNYVSTSAFPINQNDLETLEMLTDYKLSGSFQYLLNAFRCNKAEDVVNAQREFLKRLAAKTLHFELINFIQKPSGRNPKECDSSGKSMPRLIRQYSKDSVEGLLHRFLGITLYVFWSFSRDIKRKELFSTYLFHRQSPKTILNVLVALRFLSGDATSAAENFRKVFTWVSSDDSNAMEKLFFLWQTAEQSFRFNR
jgi:hypothetical protein